MKNRIRQLADEVFPDIVRLRRTIHANPELAFEEEETSRLVIDTLQPLGLKMQTGIARTGVMASLDGGRPGPNILLRADMDALPIQEENEVPYCSENPGKMHACGHDAHTASLLGTAMILGRMKEQVPGTVRFLFQPSEERLPGGAKAMIEEGALRSNGLGPAPEIAYGQHVTPDLPVGTIGVRNGMYMASADEIYITVKGEGGHAAAPHYLQSDAVVTASQLVMSLQTIISRHSPPNVPSVLSIGRLIGAGATNIIPGEAKLEGTFRAMDEKWRFRAHELIERVVNNVAEAHGAEVELEIRVGYPALENHDGPTNHVRRAAHDYVGEENTIEIDQWYASEDFSYFLQELPGSFYRLGTANEEKGITHGLHTSRFNIDEEALRIGSGFMAYVVCTYQG